MHKLLVFAASALLCFPAFSQPGGLNRFTEPVEIADADQTALRWQVLSSSQIQASSVSDSCASTYFKNLNAQLGVSAGNILLPTAAGEFFLSAALGEETLLARMNNDMSPIWAEVLNLTDVEERLFDLRLDEDGNLIGTGYGSKAGSAGTQCFAFKMRASDGAPLWLSRMNSPINNSLTKIFPKSPGGNYFLIGSTDAASGGTGCDGLLMEVDRNTGTMVWDKHYHIGSCESFSDGFIRNDTLFVCGRYNYLNGGQNGFRPAITAMDLQGNVFWNRLYLVPGTQDARLYGSSILPQGDELVLLGYGNPTGISLVSTHIYLMHTNRDGSLQWAKRFSIPSGNSAFSTKVIDLPDGYLLSGAFTDNIAANSGQQAFLIKTTKSGDLQWAREIGQTNNEQLFDIVSAGNRLHLIGRTTSNSKDVLLLGKLTLEGETVDSCDFIRPLSITVSALNNPADNLVPIQLVSVSTNYATVQVPAPGGFSWGLEDICVKNCTCDSLPDATVVIDSVFCAADDVALIVTVCNQGKTSLPAQTPISFYSANPLSAQAGVPFTAYTPAALATDGCIQFTIDQLGNWPGFQFSGNLFAVVNDDGTSPTPFSANSLPNSGITECAYDNNLDTFAVMLPPDVPTQIAIQCPADIQVEMPPGMTTTPVDYNQPDAVSNCPCGTVMRNQVLGMPSGSAFPMGNNLICYEATDDCGNASSCCFSIQITQTPQDVPCDTKTTACVRFDMLGVFQNPDGQKTYRIRVTNTCANPLIYVTFQLPNGVTAVSPANSGTFTTASGRQYQVRNPNASPSHSIRFKSVGFGISNGQSDIFEYTLPEQSAPAYIRAMVRLEYDIFQEAHLNVFNCPVQTIQTRPSASARNQALQTPPFGLYPNPATDELYLYFPEWAHQAVQVRLVDALGQTAQIRVLQINGEPIFWPLESNHPSGWYVVEVVGEDGKRQSRRFFKL
ncbi:MAG: HYR domain-containing protein [Saprospiraceae bacterium]|nr:HYR domain-containing protein [Saprospiraceae bacterium]